MEVLDRDFPGYGFKKHKGYGTRDHLDVLSDWGPAISIGAVSRPLMLTLFMNDKAETWHIGQQGEEAAAQYLTRRRLKVVERTFRPALGGDDLICRDRDTWVLSK